MNICVFGAARDEIGAEFMALGEALGREIARRGHTLVFGAGGHGMMGAAARGVYANGGRIIGVVPYFFNAPGLLFEHCSELIRMETMAERKTKMIELGDVFVAMPGGTGTLEEISEVMSLLALDRLEAPCILYNLHGYYDSLQQLLDRMIAADLSSEYRQRNIYFVKNLDELQKVLDSCLS